jgi:hypothetical protein
MSVRLPVLIVALCAFASSARAQVIYEPVQYQYGHGCNTYYYGGSDPRVHSTAMSPSGGAGRWGRNTWAFASGDIDRHREVSTEPTRTFTDAVPYMNAWTYGFTPNDARNEAYSNVPTYFRKSELLNAAVQVGTTWVVPAQAQPVRIEQVGSRIVPRPASLPQPMMIIPKDKLLKRSDKVLAVTR